MMAVDTLPGGEPASTRCAPGVGRQVVVLDLAFAGPTEPTEQIHPAADHFGGGGCRRRADGAVDARPVAHRRVVDERAAVAFTDDDDAFTDDAHRDLTERLGRGAPVSQRLAMSPTQVVPEVSLLDSGPSSRSACHRRNR